MAPDVFGHARFGGLIARVETVVADTRGGVLLLFTGGHRCPLYTSDAADEPLRVDLGGRRYTKKNTIQLPQNTGYTHPTPQNQTNTTLQPPQL